MKLPESKRDRVLLLALAAIVAALVAYVGWLVVWVPMRRARTRDMANLGDLAEKITRAERELRLAPSFARKYADAQAEMGTLVSNRLLRPILGSYQLSLQERLVPIIRGSGFQFTTVTPLGNQPLPARNSTGTFACYTAEITGTGSFDMISRLIEAILTANPYITVTEIIIQGQGRENPEAHRVSIRIEWPVLSQDKE
jgi:hypothetical protein